MTDVSGRRQKLDERRLRIVVTNDDGIHAPGLKALERVARELSDDVWVVAPETNQSGASHSLTMHRPLRIRQVGKRHYAIDGTPTDCVMLALQVVIKDGPVDLVLSGVNHGANLGEDVTYSGTIAAAMEATLLKVPAFAFSQECRDGESVRFRTAEKYGPDIVTRLLTDDWPTDILMNVNFPDRAPAQVKGYRVVGQGKRKLGDEILERIDPRGRPYVWIGTLRIDESLTEGTDLHAVAKGYVSITPVHLDLTHRPSFDQIRFALESKSGL